MHRNLICLGVIVLTLVPAGDASAKLIAHWALDETSGNVANDLSGNGYNGAIYGEPTRVPGVGGGAIDFDGVDDYAGTGQSLLSNLSEFTLACWIKPVNYTTNRTALVGQNDCIEFGFTASGNLRCYNIAVAGNVSFVYPYKSTEWHHVAATGNASGMNLYIDGKLVVGPGKAPPAGGYGASTYPVNIGAAVWDVSGNWYDGLMDDVRIYDHAMTPEELSSTMKAAGEPWPYAYGPVPAVGAILQATWATLSWTAGGHAASHNVYLGDNFADVNAGTGETFRGNQATTSLLAGLPGYAFPAGLVPGTTYYWRIDEVNNVNPDSPWKGPVWSFSIAPRTAYNPKPADGAGSVALTTSLDWTPGYGAKLHTVYLGENFDDVNNAASGGAMSGTATYSPTSLKAEKVYYWRVDETDPPNTYKGSVWSFATLGAVHNPYPSNGAAGAEMNAILTWTPSDHAASHQVYFGTDEEAVRKANTTSPEYKGTRALGAESYEPGLLAWDNTYYWRIDEINNVNPDSPWKGPVWSFTTGQSLVVDNIESYNDLPETDPASKRIYTKWIDGFGTTTNGAVVGNLDVPLTQRSNVHGGAQAMPLSYDNNLKFSEATLTLAGVASDWARQGVAELSLWFRGLATNTAEKMYVVLNGTAVVYNNDATLTQRTGWTQWAIPLQQFVGLGVNLSNVTSITIGFGTRGSTTVAGGTGQMYFDDIRLYRPATP